MATFSAGMIEGLFRLKDEVTPTLKQIEKSTKEVTKSINRDLGVVSVKGIGDALKKDVGGLLAGGLAAGAAAVAGGLALATKSMLDLADSTSNLSAATGIGVESLQKLGFAGQAVGLDVEQIASGMQKFQRNLVEGSKGTVEALNQLGLGREALANMLPEDQLETVLTALNDKVPNAANRTQIAMELLGKSGAALIPLGAGIGDVMKRAEELGLVMSSSDVAAADALGDSVGALGATFGGLVNTIGSVITSNQSLHTLVVGLQDVVAMFTKGVRDNRGAMQDLVSGGVELVVSGLIAMIDVVDLAKHAWDALRVTWLSAQNVAGALAKTQLELRLAYSQQLDRAAGGKGDSQETKDLKAQIAMVDAWKAELSDSANAVNDSTGKWEEGIAKVRGAMEALQEKVKGVHGQTVQLTGSTNQSTVALKAGAAAAEAAAAAQKHLAEEIKNSDAMVQEFERISNLLGPSVASVAESTKDLQSAVTHAGGVSKLTDSELVKLISDLDGLVATGHAGEDTFQLLAGAMDEAAQRGDAVAEAVGFATESVEDCGDAAEETALWFESWLPLAGALSDAFHELGLNALASVADGFLDGADAAMAFEEATTKAGKAAAIVQGATSAYRSGSLLGGATTGAMLGFQVGGPIGAGIGAIGGALLGLFGKAKKLREEMRKLRDSFVESMGGMDALKQKAAAAGVSLDAMFKAKSAKQLEAAIAGIKSKLDLWDEAHEKLQAAVEKYGFTIEELGPKFKQQALDEMAANLIQDFRLLTASGIDQVTVLNRMGPAFNEYVQTALRAGAALPEAMRPMIEQLIASGQLLDENGNAFTSVEQAGISFTETLTEGLTRLIDKIDALVAALTGVGGAASRISIPDGGSLSPRSSGSGYGDLPGFAGGTGGFMNFGTGTPVMLHGLEAVVPANDWRSFAGPSSSSGGPVSIELTVQTGDVLIPPGSTLDPGQVAQAVTVAWRNNINGLADQVLSKVRERAA